MIRNILLAGLAFVVLLVVFVIWRWMSVGRGRRQRDAKLLGQLDPIAKEFEAGQTVSPQEIEVLAGRPELRYILYQMLQHFKRPELMPNQYSSSVAQGASALAYWMMHPNEFQDVPEAIEHVETIKRSVDGLEADFHVYRCMMPAGHWNAKQGWFLGLAGPMNHGLEPYSRLPGAFSRCGDTEGKVKPSDLVDWYVGMLRQKGMVK